MSKSIVPCRVTSAFVKRYLAWLDAVAIPGAEKAVARIQNRAWKDESNELIPRIDLSRLSDEELNAVHLHSWFAIRSLVTVKDAAMTEIEERDNGREEEEAEDEADD